MRVSDLLQASGVHLAKAPSIDATTERFELDLAEVRRQDLLGEPFLVEYTERFARGQPHDDVVEMFVSQDDVKVFCKAHFATAVGWCTCCSCGGGLLNLRLGYILKLSLFWE